MDKVIELLFYTAPAIVTGLVAIYYFKHFTANEDRRRAHELRKEGRNIALPVRLQAFERLTLFLERISIGKLLLRVKPTGKDPQKYADKLIAIVEQEFEHNMAQQIYVSETAWKAVVTSKNVIVKLIRTSADKPEVESASQLAEDLIKTGTKGEGPTGAAISFLKIEAQKLF